MPSIICQAKAAGGESVPGYRELLKGGDLGVFDGAFKRLNEDLNTAAALGELFANLKKASSDIIVPQTKDDYSECFGSLLVETRMGTEKRFKDSKKFNFVVEKNRIGRGVWRGWG